MQSIHHELIDHLWCIRRKHPGGSPKSSMKTSSEGAREFQNRLLPIGGRASESMEFLELRDIVNRMKRELRCLLRENIRLRLSDTPDAGCRAKALRCDIEDLIRHLVLDARDAMPGGGTVCILTGTVALDADYARTHPEVPPGGYAMLTIQDTGDGSNVTNLKALKRKAGIRKGRALGLAACYDVIDQLSGHLCVSRHAHETVIKIYLPCAGGCKHAAKQPSAVTRDIRLATCPRAV
jgi:two-component system, cell cycle sensor histidine kinase and response regulator CckA